MNHVLFDGPMRDSLLPFTFTRPVAEIRIGILTIREKWEAILNQPTSTRTEQYLSTKYPLKTASVNIMIDASFVPDIVLAEQIMKLKAGEALLTGEVVIAYCTNDPPPGIYTR